VLWVLAALVAVAAGLPAVFDDNAGVHWAWWMTAVFTEITVAVMLVEAVRERYGEGARSRDG
jgi:hypothetical protein